MLEICSDTVAFIQQEVDRQKVKRVTPEPAGIAR
jgi:hypothetical protein